MLIPPPGGSSVHPPITPSTEQKCRNFQSQLQQVSTDLAHLQKARAQLHSDEAHGAAQAQIKKDEQTIQSDAKALATTADRLFEDLAPPISHLKEIQERVSRSDQARIEERVEH